MSERDPRTDPRPSDVLRKGNRTRTVDAVYRHADDLLWKDENRKCHYCLLATWRRWARKAEVLAWGADDHL